MLAWAAAYEVDGAALAPADPPEPRLTAPDGRTFAWSDPALRAALEDDLGRKLWLAGEPAGHQDMPGTVLVTLERTPLRVEEELGRPLDLRRFRPNLRLELDADAYAEEQWKGRRLRVGEAALQFVDPCDRCAVPTRDPDTQEKWPELLRWLARHHGLNFGIRARPLGRGTVRVGDPVQLV